MKKGMLRTDTFLNLWTFLQGKELELPMWAVSLGTISSAVPRLYLAWNYNIQRSIILSHFSFSGFRLDLIDYIDGEFLQSAQHTGNKP